MRAIVVLTMLLIAQGAAPAFAAAAQCTGFKWDITQELALWHGPSTMLAAGSATATAPNIAANRLYELHLVPQSAVTFALSPGRSSTPDGAYAGLATLHLDSPGRYRIAVDTPLWIDVVGNGQLATVTDFQGQQNCDGPHKIVEFDLTGARQFVVQLSGSASAIVRLSATMSPARTF